MLAKLRGGTAELQIEGGRWRGALSSLPTVLPDCRDCRLFRLGKFSSVEED